MTYGLISKGMSSLYLGLAVFCQFEVRVPVYTVYTSTASGKGVACLTLGLKPQIGRIQKVPKYVEDISSLIYQYLVSNINKGFLVDTTFKIF
jgi:hypothetical protein